MAISVVVAVGDVADPLIAKIVERLDKLNVGPGNDPANDFGPVITKEHRDRIVDYVASAPADGVSVVRDGTDLASRPVLRGSVPARRRAPGREVLRRRDLRAGPGSGPRQHLRRGRGDGQREPYGNGVAIFTRDGNAARLFSREVTVGMIGINVPIPVPISSYSFGGWKNSLFGHSHIYGPRDSPSTPAPR